jgi:hypothetical protein
MMCYCMAIIYIVDNMPIQLHVVLASVTGAVPASKRTLQLEVKLKHSHARHKFRQRQNSGQQLVPDCRHSQSPRQAL